MFEILRDSSTVEPVWTLRRKTSTSTTSALCMSHYCFAKNHAVQLVAFFLMRSRNCKLGKLRQCTSGPVYVTFCDDASCWTICVHLSTGFVRRLSTVMTKEEMQSVEKVPSHCATLRDVMLGFCAVLCMQHSATWFNMPQQVILETRSTRSWYAAVAMEVLREKFWSTKALHT